MTRKPRTTSLGVGLLIAVTLVAGCQPKVGTAAQVGDTRITTDQLNDATEAAAPTSSASPAPSAPTQSDVLTRLIQRQLLLDLVKQHGVTVPQSAIDDSARAITEQNAAQGTKQSEAAVQLAAESQAAFVVLAEDYAKKGAKPDSADIIAFPVKDQQTGDQAVAAINAAPETAQAVGQKYATKPDQVQQVRVALSQVPELAGMEPGQTKVVTIQGQLYVVHVNTLLSAAGVQEDLATVSKVTVNPRYGTWDPKSVKVGPAVSDVVSPAPSQAAVPSGAAPSGPAPSAAAPSAAAPSS